MYLGTLLGHTMAIRWITSDEDYIWAADPGYYLIAMGTEGDVLALWHTEPWDTVAEVHDMLHACFPSLDRNCMALVDADAPDTVLAWDEMMWYKKKILRYWPAVRDGDLATDEARAKDRVASTSVLGSGVRLYVPLSPRKDDE